MNALAIAIWFLRDTLQPKRAVTAVLLGIIGPLFALLFRAFGFIPAETYDASVQLGIFSATLVLAAIAYGGGIVTSEVLGGTIPLLLTRPVPRWALFIGKWMGAVALTAAISVVGCVVTAILSFGSDLDTGLLLRDMMVLCAGAVTYVSLFGLLSVLSKRPWLIAAIFGFFWETWVTYVPGDFRRLSVMTYLKQLSPHADVSGQENPLEALSEAFQTAPIDPLTCWNTLAVLTILSLAISIAVFSTAEFLPTEEAG